MTEADIIIKALGLLPHPEGGYYKEIYRSEEIINVSALPERYPESRNFSTSIYYMLLGKKISHFHQLKSDEIWHFYSGSPVIIHCLNHDGYSKNVVGNNILKGELPQFIIKKGTWFAAEVADKNNFSLIGCTVAPGFDFKDFLLASRNELTKEYPLYNELITKFTYDK
jgi:uncharacterized protein